MKYNGGGGASKLLYRRWLAPPLRGVEKVPQDDACAGAVDVFPWSRRAVRPVSANTRLNLFDPGTYLCR
jgi:hypothetical protein